MADNDVRYRSPVLAEIFGWRRRDTETTAVYMAEEQAFRGSEMLTARPGLDALRADTEAIMSSLWWYAHLGLRKWFVHPTERGSRGSSCTVSYGYIIDIRYADDAERFTVTHELAHAANAITYRRPDRHGPIFRAWHVALVAAAFGEEWGLRLTDSYRQAELAIGPAPQVLDFSSGRTPVVWPTRRPARHRPTELP